jgi:hypothetical protein
MIELNKLLLLAAQWAERGANLSHPQPYRDALNECLFELNSLIHQTLLDNLTEQDAIDYLVSQEADAYLSSMEAHEHVA